MTPFPVPSRLAAHSAGRAGWLATLPDAVAGLAERWSLALGPPFEPGGEGSWVAPAGPDRVLKVGFPAHAEARDEAAGLRVWDGDGAVRVLAEHADDAVTALLLERALPGTPLAQRPGPEQDEVLTGLLRRLWRTPPAGHPFRPLATLCDAWAAEAEPDLGHLDPGLVRDGLALFRALPRDDVPPVLLTTGAFLLTMRRATVLPVKRSRNSNAVAVVGKSTQPPNTVTGNLPKSIPRSGKLQFTGMPSSRITLPRASSSATA